MQTLLIWTGFLAFIALLIALDLGVFHRKAHVISVKEALKWTAIWVTTALLFNVAVYYLYDSGLLHGTEIRAVRGDDGVLLAAVNVEVAVRRDLADIARVQPAVFE